MRPGDPSPSARCVVERSDLRAAILSLLRFPNLGFPRSRRHPHALRNMGLGAIIFAGLSPQRQVIVQTSPTSYHGSRTLDSLALERLLQALGLALSFLDDAVLPICMSVTGVITNQSRSNVPNGQHLWRKDSDATSGLANIFLHRSVNSPVGMRCRKFKGFFSVLPSQLSRSSPAGQS